MVGKTALYTYLHLDKKNKGSLYLSCRHTLRRKKQRLVAPTKWEREKVFLRDLSVLTSNSEREP